ncbi:MAG: hypothetical protein HFJ58_00880 [Clostridia bacterium]|nr:hypothetical protein [Clostridia bacterium]
MKNKGITLIALVITIIILLILAGVIINIALGKNGLLNIAKTAGENYKIEGIKETIEAEILAIDIEKISKGETLTIEQALVEIKQKGTFEEIDIEENTGIIQGYIIELGYNENGKVVITDIEKDTGTRITVKLTPSGYTNQNIELEIGVNPKEIKITNIEVPSTITKNEQGKYEVSKNGTYLIKVTLENGEKLEKEIKIETIDKIPPKSFEITAENTETGFIISGNTIDGEATNENASSGIDRYEYIVVNEYGAETTYNTNEITGIEPGKYTIYAVAYDKAGNLSEKDNGINIRHNFYEWNKYSCYMYKYRLADAIKKDRVVKGSMYNNAVIYDSDNELELKNRLDSMFDRSTGEFNLSKSIGGNKISIIVDGKVSKFFIVRDWGDKSRVYLTYDRVCRESTNTRNWTVENCITYESYDTGTYEKGSEHYGVVSSTNSEEYPQNDYKDGFWYEKID